MTSQWQYVCLPVDTSFIPTRPPKESNRSPTRTQFDVWLWCRVRPHQSRRAVTETDIEAGKLARSAKEPSEPPKRKFQIGNFVRRADF
jgi:hypothetical protein